MPAEWDGVTADDGLSIMSSEGEADYYTTLVCFRKLVEGEDHSAVLSEVVVPPITQSKCNRAWGKQTQESMVCQRAALASLGFLNFIKDFPISLENTAEEVAEKIIIDQYPSRQCRLDTLVAGSLCRTQFPLQLDRNSAAASDCRQEEARRPACWFPHLEKPAPSV